VQVGELVPGGQGSVMLAIEAETETVGATFGGIGNPRGLRCPAKNWKMNPFGSSEGLNAFGKPPDVTFTLVDGITTIPRPGTNTFVI
jgi:hypothetical protein